MTGVRRHKRHAPITDINMIPLIDVSLVLLIIFMVMTPFLVQHQIRVNLPHSVSVSESPDRPIVVMVQRDGELSLNGKAVSASMLEDRLQAELSSNRNKPLMIQADRDVVLQKVVSVMDVAKRLNVVKLGISVETQK